MSSIIWSISNRMPDEDKVKENKLRRAADRRGLRLEKSRSRDPNAIDYGLYAVIDVQTNNLINPAIAGRWKCSWTLDEVDEYLNPSDKQ
jgi:hypothetical protein